MNFKKNYKLRCLYNVLIFSLVWADHYTLDQEGLFKSDNDVFSDEEFYNFIKKRRIRNTTRGCLGAYLPIPVSLLNIYDNNLNIIENEAISTNLTEEQKKEYIIYDEITKYNETPPDSQINDCFKIKDENLLNDYMARYKVDNKDKLAAPIYFTNLLKFATIMGKMNEYNNKNTECEFGLHGLEGEVYKNRLGETIKSLPVLAEKSFLESCLNNEGEINLDEDKKKRLEEMRLVKTEEDELDFGWKKIYPKAGEIKKEIQKSEEKTTEISEETKKICQDSKYKTYDKDAINLKICHLNNLEKQQEEKELSEYMTYGKIKPFKSLIYYNFNFGASNTLWINKRFGWEIDLSGSFSYFDFKKSLFLSEVGEGTRNLFFGQNDGNGNLEFGFLNGHILNQNVLKQESVKKAINDKGNYVVSNFGVKEVGKFSGNFIFNFLGKAFKYTLANHTTAKNLYYCQENADNTRDCATNFFVTKKFILKKEPTGCFNIGCNLKQINVYLKTGIAINLSNPILFLKNYRGKLFNNSHQLVFNVGCIANINFWNLNLKFDIDEKALQYEGKAENMGKYNQIAESYKRFLDFKNIKKMESWLKEDFIQQYKFRPMFEIKYRLDSTVHVSFEVGLRFIFRSAFNFDIDKAGMRAYWENAVPQEDKELKDGEIPKYDNNTTDQQLQERKGRILDKIDNWGIKWFYNFDMCLFFSIGFNIIK